MTKSNAGFKQVKVRDHVYLALVNARLDMQDAWDQADPSQARKARVSMTEVIEQLLRGWDRPAPVAKPKRRRKK